MSVNPGPPRARMRALATPGENPMTLRTREEFAPRVADLCGPDWKETGKIYDFPQDKVLQFQGAA